MKRLLSRRYLSLSPEYAYEMSSSNVRFGRGVTYEVGQDILNFGVSKNVCIFTDQHIKKLAPFRAVLDSLTRNDISFEVYGEVFCEPTDQSFQHAIEFSKKHNFEAFIAIGGGSVIDTAKAANLYMSYPTYQFLDFVNAPVGKGIPVPGKVKPLIAIPTTAGTGSETTGVSIFDHTGLNIKTGLRDKALRPILGLIDPNHTDSCSPELVAYSGLDVLCHALESFTAIPYSKRRSGAPSSPKLRPPYQGSNPIADIWTSYALKQSHLYLRRAVEGPQYDTSHPFNGEIDYFAREQMALASTAAGIGFGNAGVHLCHAMSYAIASNLNKRILTSSPLASASNYLPPSGYDFAVSQKLKKYQLSHNNNNNNNHHHHNKLSDLSSTPISPLVPSSPFPSLVPHGLSVVLTAPAVFKWTASANPERHLQAAALLGADVSRVSPSDAGLLLSDTLIELLSHWSFLPNGLKGIGYDSSSETLDLLVSSTLPQKRLLEISPKEVQPEDLYKILEESMKLF